MKYFLLLFLFLSFQHLSLASSRSCKDSFSFISASDLRKKILLEFDKGVRPERMGQKGYIQFSIEYFNGNMQKAFINTSSVLSKSTFAKLDWQQFQGTTKEFKQLLSLILDQDSNPRSEYIGQTTGYLLFADRYFNGNMQKAFINTSSVLSKSTFAKFGWKQFQGTTDQFQNLFNYFQTHSFEDYKGRRGQRKIAQLIFNDSLLNAYQNISSLRKYLFAHPDVFKDLRKSGWSLKLK